MDTTPTPHLEHYAKQRIALRYWLLGRGYHRAAVALGLAETHHTGMRRDGVSPELSHQIAIASHLRTLHQSLRHPEESIAVALLHDIREDHNLADAEIREPFGDLVADAVDAMTKIYRGVRRDEAEVFATIAANPIASVAKLADRCHNLQTMIGAFSAEKMAGYVAETEEWFMPMLKQARRSFPDQELAFENLKLTLESQMELLGALLQGGERGTRAER